MVGNVSLNRNLSSWLAPLAALLVALCVVAGVKIVLLSWSPAALPSIDFQARAPGADIPLLYPSATHDRDFETLAKASIDARLLGVAGMGDRVVASIAVNGGRERIVAVGDNLAEDVTVAEILPRAVVVREHGILRQIVFKPLGSGKSEALVEAVEPDVTDRLPAMEASMVMLDSGDSGLRIERLSGDLSGLELVAEGDVVVAVDDQPLSALLANPDAMASVTPGNAVTLTLIRAGTTLDVDVEAPVVNRLLAQ